MATIIRRKSKDGKLTYLVRIRRKGSVAQTATFHSLKDAKKYAQIMEGAILEGRHFHVKEATKHTLGDMIERYTREILPHKKKNTIVNQKQQLQWWDAHLGHKMLSDITPRLIAEYKDILIQEYKANSTVRRYLSALSHMYTVGIREWNWVEDNPVLKINKPKEPRGRVRFLSEGEKDRLLQSCKESRNPYLYTVVVLSLSIGGRKNELMTLEWRDIDFKRNTITFRDTKNDETRSVPLTGYAQEVFMQHAKIRRLNTNLIFPNSTGSHALSIREAFTNAIERADIQDFHFHDLRHTFASYLAMNGASLLEIAELLGHKTLAMVKRYAHLTEAHTKNVVERMNRVVFEKESMIKSTMN